MQEGPGFFVLSVFRFLQSRSNADRLAIFYYADRENVPSVEREDIPDEKVDLVGGIRRMRAIFASTPVVLMRYEFRPLGVDREDLTCTRRKPLRWCQS